LKDKVTISGPRILVVEDDEFSRDVLSRRLRRLRWNIETARGGAEAIEMLRQRSYDAVLLDWMMPGMSGLEVLTRIRETRSAVQLPVIMVTARTDPADVVEAFERGANDYVTKPVQLPVVHARLRTHVALSEAAGRLEWHANHDPLTGICNRRHALYTLDSLVQIAGRYGQPLALCMCDLDNYKQVNDTHGHVVGDDVLVAFAAAAQEVMRKCDVVARYGGDEFLIIMPQTEAQGAIVAMERLRTSFGQKRFSGAQDAEFSVTATFGVAMLVEEAANGKGLITAADAALYSAKRAGRNQVWLDGFGAVSGAGTTNAARL